MGNNYDESKVYKPQKYIMLRIILCKGGCKGASEFVRWSPIFNTCLCLQTKERCSQFIACRLKLHEHIHEHIFLTYTELP